jgi:predicted O-methyltransferase YrrM
MDEGTFNAVDEFIVATIAADDAALAGAIADAAAEDMPEIAVTPPQGKLLTLLARSIGARTILEFGTLGGYSTIHLARALPADGRLVTLEAKPEFARVARASIDRAGVGELVDIRVGPALETLPVLDEEGFGPVDFTFIDADKVNTPHYFAWALDHARPGALIVADNVVRHGTLADPHDPDPATKAQREFHEMLAKEPRVAATTIQTVGAKGHDGFTLALVES